MHTTSPMPGPGRPAPLWAGLLFTFLNSIATGVVGSMIYVLTKQAYHFDLFHNFMLGVVVGVVYIAGAKGVSPAIARLRASGLLSSRAILALLMAVMAVLCAAPWAAARTSEAGAVWPIWLTVAAYNALNGALWPMVESYISGGRTGPALRRTLGVWNVTWSSATATASLGLAALIEHHALLAILLLGILHAASALILLALPPEPAAHEEEHHEPHPPVYDKLLVTFRILLPASYMVYSAVGPFMPDAARMLGLGPSGQAAAPIAWLLPRVFTFAILQASSRWHGRWAMPVIGAAFLLTGFATAVLAPYTLSPTVGLRVFVLGLVLLGIGMATIYTGALYYAMTVGRAQVDAGGTHEALIGLGYTVGPSLGLLAAGADRAGYLPAGGFAPTFVVEVGLVALVAAGIAARRIHAHAGAQSAPAPEPLVTPPEARTNPPMDRYHSRGAGSPSAADASYRGGRS